MADVKVLTHPQTGKEYKLGRNKPLTVPPHLRLGNYMLRKMPQPPATYSYIPPARSFLAEILGNDDYGDCTCAAAFHISGSLLLNANQLLPTQYTAQTVVNFYMNLTGGADTGLDEQQVFNYWQSKGLLGDGVTHRILARVFVDPTDVEQIQAAIWLFGNLYVTASLPDAWVNPMPSGDNFVWDVADNPDPDNGHAWMACSYGSGGIGIDTWGLLGTETYEAVAKYNYQKAGGGCYSVISSDALNKATQKAPNGFDWTQLTADIASFHS